MAATEKTIRETLGASLQWTLFGLLRDKESCEAGSEKTDEYNRAYLSNLATELLSQVGYGRQDEAERMLKKSPEVLLFRPSRPVNDIAGNLFAGTAFQYALWAMDTRMYQMMLACLPENEHGETIRKGLLEQAKAQIEHFDFKPLIRALQTYVDHYDHWSWFQRQDYWCKVLGEAQKTLPAHVRQEYCNPDPSFYPMPNFTEKVLKRFLRFYNWRTATWQIWDESLLGLGSDFAITRGCFELLVPGAATSSASKNASIDLKVVMTLCEVRTSDLSSLMQRLQLPIWKPEDTELVSRQMIV